MTKSFQIILTVSAAVLFILAFLLDLSFFGQNWTDVWKNFDATRFAVIIAIIIASGLFIGLLIFRKQPYRQRLVCTLPIAFIAFSLADITNVAANYYGLDEDYNYFTAKQDIRSGKIQMLETGLLLPEPGMDWEKQQAAQNIIEQHFGYKSVYLGCTFTTGIGMYNEVMEDYLNNINGKDWRTKERQMRDSIIKLQTLK